MKIVQFKTPSFYFVGHIGVFPVTFFFCVTGFPCLNWVTASVAVANQLVKTKPMKALR